MQNVLAKTEPTHTGLTFYFEDRLRADIRKKLFHLTAFGHQVLFLASDTASGKTTFLNYFLDHYQDNWHSVRLDARTHKSGHDVVRELSRCLNVDPVKSAENIDVLRARLDELVANDELLLITVDHAENISDEMLATLFAVYVENNQHGPHLRLLFCGRHIKDSLRTAMDHCGIPSEQFVALELPPFDEEQTAEYIEQRLLTLGVTTTTDKSAIKKAHYQSNGQPGLIDQFIANFVVKHANPALKTTPERISSRKALITIIAAALVITTGVGVLLFKKQNTALPQPEIAAEEPQNTDITPLPPVLTTTLPEPSDESSVPLIETAPVITLAETNTTQTEPAAPLPLTQTKPTELAKPENKEEDKKQNNVEQPAPIVKDTSIVKREKSAEPERATTLETAGLQNVAWINQQNPKHFTLQLIAASSEKVAQEFSASNKLDGPMAFFRIKRDGKIFYPVIYGSYATKAEAEKQQKIIEKSVKNTKPWVRSFSSIQRETR